MTIAPIIAGISTAASLAESIQKMSNVIPSPPKDLTDKHRWVTVTVFNQTQYNLLYISDYFDSGRFWTAPTNVEPFNEMTFSGCDSDGSFLTGVSGGTVFELQMPQQGGGYTKLDIGIGFTNPQAGALKSSGVFTSSAQTAYDDVTNTTTSILSPLTYSGTDTNNNPTTIQFLLVSAPGQEASITVTEQIVSGGA